MEKNAIEKMTQVVYGETFGRYSKEEFIAFMEPFKLRLEKNGIPLSVFKGKRCLDAGCGGGRGSVLMAQAGAEKVVSFDLTPQNIETTRRHAELFGIKNIETHCGNLSKLPFKDNEFDIVWCNGVLHHTIEVDGNLREVIRVLKPGGNMWLYLYGSGGVYWHMVFFFREWLKDIDIPFAVSFFALMGIPTGRIAEFIDNWYVPILLTYTHDDISRRLGELGMSPLRRLMEGTSYDTCRRIQDGTESKWLGGGDLRYWGTKSDKSPTTAGTHPLSTTGRGSDFEESPDVIALNEDFEALKNTVARFSQNFPDIEKPARLMIAARVQLWLRDRLSETTPFDGKEFRAWLCDLTKTHDRLFFGKQAK